MKKYIFYTNDGFSQDKNLQNTENCQILGLSQGENVKHAYDNLIKENDYILSHNYENIMAYEINGELITL